MPGAAAEPVGASYDRLAERYIAHVIDELTVPSADRAAIDLFADLLGVGAAVLDAGCGPGHIANHLARQGLVVTGVDASPELIAHAASFHRIDVSVGDLMDLPFADAAFDGVIARHSLIHTDPAVLGHALDELGRVLAPGGLLLVSFFAANERTRHGQPFDHAVCTAYEFDPDTVSTLLRERGLEEEARVIRQPAAGERPLPHVAIIARSRPVEAG